MGTKLLAVLASVTLMFLAAAPARAVPLTFGATLSGMDEVLPVNTMASGQASFVLSDDGTTLTYTLTVANLADAVAAHIHLAPMGSNGPVVVSLFAGAKPGVFSGMLASGTITTADLVGPLLGMDLSALVAELGAGRAYVNVHTNAHPAGEIRGQIVAGM